MKQELTLCRTVALSDTEVTGMQFADRKAAEELSDRLRLPTSFLSVCLSEPAEGEISETLVLAQVLLQYLYSLYHEERSVMSPRQDVKAEWGSFTSNGILRL